MATSECPDREIVLPMPGGPHNRMIFANCHLKHETPVYTSDNPIRAFDPTWNALYRSDPSDIISNCSGCYEDKIVYRNPPVGRGIRGRDGRVIDGGSIVIHIDGACRGNGTPYARAAYGYVYGIHSGEGTAGLLPPNIPQTNQRAELYAAEKVLHDIIENRVSEKEDGEFRRWCKILILTDSDYLVKGISDYIWKWKRNGFLTAKRQPVVNSDAFKKLDQLMEYIERKGIPVWFWHIPRGFNQEADRAANWALDGFPDSD
ncbi:hypothetical protein B7494_g1676 [Chlorociboria aeruginascens]|nr:hypothetical protein B7494_g1676 [Chlorociboria aeruginascens]